MADVAGGQAVVVREGEVQGLDAPVIAGEIAHAMGASGHRLGLALEDLFQLLQVVREDVQHRDWGNP
jgi:hypothetical protein